MIVGLFIGFTVGAVCAAITLMRWRRLRELRASELLECEKNVRWQYEGRILRALTQVTPKANATVKRMAKILRGEA